MYVFLLTFFVSVMGFSQYAVDFEGASEVKTAYTSGEVTLSGLQWNMTEALIGTTATDWKNGTKSARLRGYATSSMSMIEDKTDGLGTLSFSYQRYGTDAQVAWKVEYSTDLGETWTQIGTSFTALAESTVQIFSEQVNVEGNVRVRIIADIASGTANKRLNIDDITLTNFPASAQSPLINVSSNLIDNLNYLVGNGPSNNDSFTISISDLNPAIGNLVVTASENFEVSTDNLVYVDFLNIVYSENLPLSTEVFVRLKNNLTSGFYSGTVTVSGGEAADKIVNVSGNVAAPFAIPYENNFRTQANLDAAVVSGFTFDGEVTWGGTGGGGYTKMSNLSSIISPSINFSGESFIEVSFALATFGGNTGQKLALKYSSNDGLDYETIGVFNVPSSYNNFTQIVNINGFNGVGKLKFEMVEGSNLIRFRDLSMVTLTEVMPAIDPAFCGSTVNSASNDIITLAGNYDGDLYQFNLTNGENVTTIEKTTPTITFSDFGAANFEYGLTYNLSLYVKYGEVYTQESPACEVTLAANPLTSVENYCGLTVPSIHSKVYVFGVTQASSYRYSITNLTTNTEQLYVSNRRFFTFASLDTFDFATNYEVKAQVKIGDGEYGAFGAVCIVTTPDSVTSKLRDEFCNSTLSTLNQNIYATFLVGADAYKFRITANGTSQEIERPDSRFSFAFAEGIQLGQVYDVEVAVRYNGVFGPYSDVCTITTPASLQTIALRPQFCGATLISLGSNFYAKFVSGATAYRFKTTINGAEVEVERPDSRCFMSAFAGAMMNQMYQIQVSFYVNGAWSAYGDVCSITVGMVDNNRISQVQNEVNFKVYPNPSTNYFHLEFNQNVESGMIAIFDLSGKMIQTIELNQVQNIEFGNDFKTGIYLVKVQVDETIQNIKLVKN